MLRGRRESRKAANRPESIMLRHGPFCNSQILRPNESNRYDVHKWCLDVSCLESAASGWSWTLSAGWWRDTWAWPFSSQCLWAWEARLTTWKLLWQNLMFVNLLAGLRWHSVTLLDSCYYLNMFECGQCWLVDLFWGWHHGSFSLPQHSEIFLPLVIRTFEPVHCQGTQVVKVWCSQCGDWPWATRWRRDVMNKTMRRQNEKWKQHFQQIWSCKQFFSYERWTG